MRGWVRNKFCSWQILTSVDVVWVRKAQLQLSQNASIYKVDISWMARPVGVFWVVGRYMGWLVIAGARAIGPGGGRWLLVRCVNISRTHNASHSVTDLKILQAVQALLVDILAEISLFWGLFEPNITYFLLRMQKEKLKMEIWDWIKGIWGWEWRIENSKLRMESCGLRMNN